LPTLSNPSFADSVIYAQGSQPRPSWRFVVPNEHSVALLIRPRQGLDAGASSRLVRAVRATVTAARIATSRTTISGVPALVAALSSEVRSEVPELGIIAFVAVGACFLLVPWTRVRSRLRPLVSTVLAVGMTLATWGWTGRPLSLGVISFLPVLLGIGAYYPTYLARHRDRRTVLVVAAATAASFASLVVSPLPFVRDMGLTMAMGVTFSALVGVALTRRPARESARPPAKSAAASRTPWRVVCVVAGAVAVCGWLLLPSLPLQTNFEHYTSGLSALDDANHVASTVGSSAEIDVVLTGRDVLTPAAYRWLNAAQADVITRHGDEAHPVVSLPSLLSFLGQSPTSEEIAAGARLVPDYLLGAAVSADHGTAVLSYGVDITDLPRVQAMAHDIIATLPTPPAGYRARLVGLPVVAARGEQLVSGDRILVNVLGIAAATLVLSCGLSRRRDALRACAAATLAAGTGLFLLWLAGVALTPVTVALGTLTAAVGSEFTVMLAESTRAARRGVRTSVLLAVAASAAGYLTLLASSLGVIREFGLLLAGGVLIAFFSAVVVVRATCAPAPPTKSVSIPKSKPVLVGAK
jgi:predicted RND superfamily exporter protein